MARKNFFEKAINRKIGGMKRSAKANLKKEVKNSSCLVKLLSIFGWLIIIGIIIALIIS